MEAIVIITIVVMFLAFLGISIGTMMVSCSIMGVRRTPGPLMALAMVFIGGIAGSVAAMPVGCVAGAMAGSGLEWVAVLGSVVVSVAASGWVYARMLGESTGTGIGIAVVQSIIGMVVGGALMGVVYALGWLTLG